MKENTTNEISINKELEDIQETTGINTYLEISVENQSTIINNQQRIFTANIAILYICCLFFLYIFVRNMTNRKG